MSKRKKTSAASPPNEVADTGSITTRVVVPPEVMKRARGNDAPVVDAEPDSEPEESGEGSRGNVTTEVEVDVDVDDAPEPEPEPASDLEAFDSELTVNLVGELPLPGRDDLDEPTVTAAGETLAEVDDILDQRRHLRGLLEALVFASDSPIAAKELARLASAQQKQVRDLLAELQVDYATRGMHLDEVAGGWVFRTSPEYAPFVRDLTKQKPVKLTRAQVETLAIIAYRQPITRPEVDDVRGVDSGPVLKLLLERDLVRILGKRDEVGRPLIYGTTGHFLEFFGLKSLKDLPTLREFTELSDESREAFEDELGETPEDADRRAADAEARLADANSEEAAGRAVHGEYAEQQRSDDDSESESESESDGEGEGEGDSAHAADDDGPTLTSEAPPSNDNE